MIRPPVRRLWGAPLPTEPDLRTESRFGDAMTRMWDTRTELLSISSGASYADLMDRASKHTTFDKG